MSNFGLPYLSKCQHHTFGMPPYFIKTLFQVFDICSIHLSKSICFFRILVQIVGTHAQKIYDLSKVICLVDGNLRKDGTVYYIYGEILYAQFLPGKPFNASSQLEVKPKHGNSNNHRNSNS